MSGGSHCYVVVSPVRNEAAHLRKTIDSMLRQTERAAQWVIVDDGSTDGTLAICRAAAEEASFITVIERPRRDNRRPGAGVVEAFYDGYAALAMEPWKFLVKLDGDLSFEADYFERCFKAFDQDPKLGITSGAIAIDCEGRTMIESPNDPPFHVRGASKIYRRECWGVIGGLARMTGWDTIDELKANMHGWGTRTLTYILVVHHRPTGGADGRWKDAFKNGRANYITGYHPLFMAAKCVRRAVHQRRVIPALGLLCGFATGYLKSLPRVDDCEMIRYLRQQQISRLRGRTSLWTN